MYHEITSESVVHWMSDNYCFVSTDLTLNPIGNLDHNKNRRSKNKGI